MISPDTPRGTLAICIDDDDVQRDDEQQRRGLYFGNIYEVELIEPNTIEVFSNEKSGIRDSSYVVSFYNLGIDEQPSPVNYYSTARFALASEYQTVIDFYRDLIRNPPENKSC